MQKVIIVFTLLLLATLIRGQAKPPLAVEEFEEGLNPFEEIRLFDLNEIKAKKIDTAYIIYHPASWAEYHPLSNPCTCSYNDTLSRYVFDTEGRIIEYTYFQQLGDYSTIFHYDTLGNRKAISHDRRFGAKAGSSRYTVDNKPDTSVFKQRTNRRKEGGDSIITIITFLKFKQGLDTATIATKRYNKNGRLVETKSAVNKRNAREFDDDIDASTYHFNYNYDRLGRLIYYRDFSTQDYWRIFYPFYGKLTEIYNSANGQLKNRVTKTVKEKDGVITITIDRKQITLTPLTQGSKLYKLRTVVEPGEFPLLYYHEIVYKSKQAIKR